MEKEVDIERIEKLRSLMIEDDSISEIRIDEMRDLRKLKYLLAVRDKSINLKQLGQEMGKDYRTIKKYIYGYEKSKKRKKQSKLHIYEEEIKSVLGKEKFKNIRTLWKYMKENYGLKCAESTFRSYIQSQKSFSKYFEKSSKSLTYIDEHIKNDKEFKDIKQNKNISAYFTGFSEFFENEYNIYYLYLMIPKLGLVFAEKYEKWLPNYHIDNDMITDFFCTAFHKIGGIPNKIVVCRDQKYNIKSGCFKNNIIRKNADEKNDNNENADKENTNKIDVHEKNDEEINEYYNEQMLKLISKNKYIKKLVTLCDMNISKFDENTKKEWESDGGNSEQFAMIFTTVKTCLLDSKDNYDTGWILEHSNNKNLNLLPLKILGVDFVLEDGEIRVKGDLDTRWYTISQKNLNKKKMLVKCLKNGDKYSIFIKFTDEKNDSFINI